MDLTLHAKSSRLALLGAGAIAIALEHFVPFGGVMLYPFTLLATWVHEMGHGLAAVAAGGKFDHLAIYGDASGLAWTAVAPGWRQGWVAAAGLLDPPLVGALVLATARGPKRGGAILLVLAGAILVSLVLWVRSAVGLLSMLPLAALLAAFGWWGKDARTLLAQLVGVLLGLDTVARIGYLFVASATIGGEARTSDIAAVAQSLGGPMLLWGLLLASLSFAFLGLGLQSAWSD